MSCGDYRHQRNRLSSFPVPDTDLETHVTFDDDDDDDDDVFCIYILLHVTKAKMWWRERSSR